MAVLPFSIYQTVVSVGGLAICVILGSCLLISYPIGPTLHGYFYDVNTLRNLDLLTRDDQTSSQLHQKKSPVFVDVDHRITQSTSNSQVSKIIATDESNLEAQRNPRTPAILSETEEMIDDEGSDIASSGAGNFGSSSSMNDSNSIKSIADVKPDIVSKANNDARFHDSGCDLFHGRWVHDPTGPLYTNNSCPVLTQMQNCQGNGRPDKDYENWRWKPLQCDLPRFDARKFLELMRGKTLAFVGDSVARNQMESLLCILWQVEVPKNRGSKKMQKYHFSSTSVSIVRIWSSWLVKQTNDPLSFAPDGVTKLHLDAPDDVFMEHVPRFDVIVLSSGHWFAKQSLYVLNDEIVGGQLWWPDNSRPMKVNNIDAFGISVETSLTALGVHPNYTGLTIVRSYSPDHYAGGEWNTGGSCTGKERPLRDSERVENGFTKIMHDKQVAGFWNASKKIVNKSKLRLMDITEAFEYRPDGHPGPYRSTDPNKITKSGPDGSPPPQDCLHWCMPGPIDTWNEMMLEIIRREFDDDEKISSSELLVNRMLVYTRG